MERSIYIIRFILKSEYYENGVTARVMWSSAVPEDSSTSPLIHCCTLQPLSQIEYVVDVELPASSGNRVFFQFAEVTPEREILFPLGSFVISGLAPHVPIEICETERSRSPDQSRTTIRFKMNYFTYFGQNIMVVGSTRDLGFWDKKKAFRLQHSGSVGVGSTNESQLFSDPHYNWQRDLTVDCLPPSISYKYFCEDKKTYTEESDVRTVCLGGAGSVIELNDIWRWKVLSVPLYSTRFFSTVFRRPNTVVGRIFTPERKGMIKTYFRASSIALGRDRHIRVVGSIPELGSWAESGGRDLEKRERPVTNGSQTECIGWSTCVEIPAERFPFEYKFIAPSSNGSPTLWENNENRKASRSSLDSCTESYDSWIINFPDLSFHGASVFFDFESVRSSSSPACTLDIITKVGEWASRCGFSHVQIANIFDTRAMTQHNLNLPVSGFALNPTLISLASCGFTRGSNDLESLNADKLSFIENTLFKAPRSEEEEKALKQFKKDNGYWLVDYTKLCFAARSTGDPTKEETLQYDVKNTPEYETFSDLVAFIQKMAYDQLRTAVQTCSDRNIAVGIDIPFALHQCSAEAKYRHEMFDKSCRLGVPPSKFKPVGEVFDAFPYKMERAYEWLAYRVGYFGRIFPAIRLTNTINYFRQWVVPRDSCVRAVFGHYEPSMSISSAELETWGLWDFERYSHPFIRSENMYDIFGYDSQDIENIFMYKQMDFTLAFKPEFSTEVALKNAHLTGRAEELRNKHLDKLMMLMGEVLLIKTHDHNNESDFTPRSGLNISPEESGSPSISFSALPPYEQAALLRLQNEFTMNKQKPLWASRGRQALQYIKSATQSLVLSDADGSLGEVCDDVIQKLTIVPLRVQIAGKGANHFDDVRSYPFFSVAAPAKNSCPSLAYLWDNGKIETRKLWEEELWESGQAPASFNGTVAATIMRQHCWSASLLTMFPIDTLIMANNHMLSRDQSPFSALDLPGFLQDNGAEKAITEILDQTKRKN